MRLALFNILERLEIKNKTFKNGVKFLGSHGCLLEKKAWMFFYGGKGAWVWEPILAIILL